jgi:hypothetical protein
MYDDFQGSLARSKLVVSKIEVTKHKLVLVPPNLLWRVCIVEPSQKKIWQPSKLIS